MGFVDSDFAEATGYLRVLEKKILTDDGIDKAIDAGASGDGAAAVLKNLAQNSSFGFSGDERPSDFENALKADLKATYELLFKICPDPRIVEILAAKYDYHNVKTAVKAKYLNADFSSIYVDVTPNAHTAVQAAVSEDNPELPEHLTAAINACAASDDPQMIDLIADKEMLRYMKQLADELKNEYISEYVGTVIDFYNIKTLMRVRNMQKTIKFLQDSLAPGGKLDVSLFAENFNKSEDSLSSAFYYKYFGNLFKKAVESYERSGNFGALEKLMDNYIMEQCRQSKYIAFGPEPLFAYILAKENEIRQVRILMTCKINQIPDDVLRERLRDNYA